MTDAVGYVLLGAAAVPILLGWDLSRRGLSKATQMAEQVAEAAEDLHEVARQAQPVIAEGSGEEAMAAAQQSAEVIERATDLSTGVGEVRDALKGMTGALAPARVCFALALLLVLGAFISFDLFTIGSRGTP